MPHIELSDDCPCQSGEIFERCCARSNLKPLYAITRTPKPKTGIKNLRCYASVFNDCSEKISREHFLSEGILRILNENNNLTVAGFPWLKEDEHRKLNPASLVGNILCERHNNALSSLDAVAIRFFKAFYQIEQEFSDDNLAAIERVFLFNGHDIERWMLKLFCGLLFSKNVIGMEERITGWIPKITWLNMLFGIQHFPNDCGIYYEAIVGKRRGYYQGMDIAPLSNQDNVIVGAQIYLKEHNFIFTMSAPPKDHKGTILEESVYRPTELTMKKGKKSIYKVIVLAWDSPKGRRPIEMTTEEQI